MCVKKLMCLASFVLVLALVVDVQAATIHWNGNGADDLWSTLENWSTGAPPTVADKFRMIQIEGGPTIVNEGAVALDGWVGAPLEGDKIADLTVDGGTLTTGAFIVVGRRNGDNGKLIVNSGSVRVGNTLYLGHTGEGALDMTGGTITAPANLVIGLNSTAVGHANLDGGIINAGGLVMRQQVGSVGTMDVKAGTLVTDGNDLGAIQGYIDNASGLPPMKAKAS